MAYKYSYPYFKYFIVNVIAVLLEEAEVLSDDPINPGCRRNTEMVDQMAKLLSYQQQYYMNQVISTVRSISKMNLSFKDGH